MIYIFIKTYFQCVIFSYGRKFESIINLDESLDRSGRETVEILKESDNRDARKEEY